MEAYWEIIVGVQFVLLIIFALIDRKTRIKNSYYINKYSKIINVDEQVEKAQSVKSALDKDIENIRESYKSKKIIFNQLVKEAAIYDEIIELADLGFYTPHFDFDTSEKYKETINELKTKQKSMISNKKAIVCHQEWTVDGSKTKGKTMTNRGIRLTARAFNNECDAAISNTSWNNISRMEQRIQKAYEAINKLNASNRIEIAYSYFELKINELRLTHEYKDKKQKEKEEQAAIRAQMREEAKLDQEIEKALKEEDKYNKLLAKAQAEADKSVGTKLEKLNEKILALSQELEVAHSKSERAKSMAQQTKLGHVYVISNIGSFGDNVFKIGMTRRLEPYDRVKELGDASVPFIFDVHAMIYTDDAPALENKLHKSFDYKRVNLVNSRKEFFNVTLNEIEKEVKKLAPTSEFIETAEARQHKESQAIRLQREQQSNKASLLTTFPETI